MQSGGKTWEIRPSPAQNRSESQYSCIFQEPMNWSKYPYIVIRVKCTLDKNTPAFLKSHYLRARVANQTFPSSNSHATSRCTFQKFPHQPLLLHPNKLGWQRSGTVSWVLSDWLGAQHPLSSVIKLGIRHSRKKERKKEESCRTLTRLSVPLSSSPSPLSNELALTHAGIHTHTRNQTCIYTPTNFAATFLKSEVGTAQPHSRSNQDHV